MRPVQEMPPARGVAMTLLLLGMVFLVVMSLSEGVAPYRKRWDREDD
jgi:hypothetical protein